MHAKTKEELFANLIKVFERFRKHKITFNPDKVHLSDMEMEFIGHEITHEGIHFSKKKLNGVQNIPRPATKGELKKFLGVANYFRSHVKNHSILAHPLQSLLPMYTRTHRNHKIVWTDQMEKHFIELRDNVANCPKLFFIEDYWKIGMEIDASDYGIGGFLFQVNPATEEKSTYTICKQISHGPTVKVVNS